MDPIFYTVRSINGDYASLVSDDGREHSITSRMSRVPMMISRLVGRKPVEVQSM